MKKNYNLEHRQSNRLQKQVLFNKQRNRTYYRGILHA
jgi:hypothetical protein